MPDTLTPDTMPDLLTIDDIAARFRRSRRTVADEWVQRPDFPPPKYAPTRRTRLWLASDVERWASPASARCPAESRGSTSAEGFSNPDAR